MTRDPLAARASSSPATGRILADGITGRLPPELANLSNLESLWLGDNLLTGSIPKELANLSRLDFLNLGSNSLTGTIPSGMTGLSRSRTCGSTRIRFPAQFRRG